MSFELTFDDEPDLYDSRVSDAIDALTAADIASPSTPSITSPYLRVESPTSLSDEFGSTGNTPIGVVSSSSSSALTSVVSDAPPTTAALPVDLTVQSRIVSAAEVTQSALISLQSRVERYESDATLDQQVPLPRSEAYLRPFTRVAKLDAERALLRLVLQRQWLVANVEDDRSAHRLGVAMFRTVLRRGAVQPLAGLDATGHACLLVRVRVVTNSSMDTAAITRLAVYIAGRWLRERGDVLSLVGATILLDWRDAECGTREIGIARAVLDALQRRWPIRVGSIVVIGAPVMATMAWRLLRAVVSAKLVARVKFCSEAMPLVDASDDARGRMRAELTALGVDASTLPRDLGGADTVNDDTPWLARLEVDESNLVTLRAKKSASVDRLGAKVDPDNKFKVLTVAEESFSATLGLLVDDWIVKFNGADVIAVSDLKLRGNEEYDVEVVVLRPDRAFNLTDVQ